MQFLVKDIFKSKRKWTQQAGRLVVVLLIAALFVQVAGPLPDTAVFAAGQEASAESANGFLDEISFGNAESESAHHFKGELTSVITGLFGETARISHPRFPVQGQGGDLTFAMKVDPYLRNYLTVKFSGNEDSKGYLSLIFINGEKVGFDHGDYESINKGYKLQNRFLYTTIMLPLESTVGKDRVEITIKTIHPPGNMNTASRGHYKAYTHTQPRINVDGEQQGYKYKSDQNLDTMLGSDLTDEEKQALIDDYVQGHINHFNWLSNIVDGSTGGKMSIIRYQDDLMFYASALKYDWSPAKTPEEKRAALQRIFKTIDNHVKDYYGNTRLVLRGGHQGDWGGYYGALGEALYIVENLIKDDTIYGDTAWNAFLDESFVTGTVEGEFSLAGVDWNGGELTRREAWERVLKANFDFARTRLSYIYNQVYYTYVGAWEAHEGLRLIDSSFYEGKERSNLILLESLGIRPFLGEEVLVGPNGEELDLYHSLFYHDGSAVFTDDFVHIVGKGLAKSKLDADGNVVRRLPYGKHYTGLTEAGLTRENGYVANYGEAANYLVTYFYKTLNHAGDEEMNDEILQGALRSIHARGFVRIPSLDDSGRRVMRAEQTTDDRNQVLPGFIAYGASVGRGMGLQFASLEMTMAKNEQRYSGPEWDKYWQYARETVGYVQQQLADHQLLHTRDFGNRGTMSGRDYMLAETYNYIVADRADYERFNGNVMAGVVLPHTDFDAYKPEETASLGVKPEDYEQFAWADIDNMYVSVKDGDFRMLGSLFFRNKGISSNGRLHIIKDNYDQIVQVATNNVFQYEDYYLRVPNIDLDIYSDRSINWSGAPQALAGEVAPVSYQPGVGTVNRDNFEVDHPYSGYPELQTSRYGKYFIIFNTTRDEFGNKQTYNVELPADYTGSAVLDLVSGTNVPVVGGKVDITPKTVMVLKLTSDIELAPKPFHVDFVNALAGNGYVGISWKTTSGGQSYTIKRSETEDGEYEIISSGVTGNYFKDTTVQNGKVYYYKVAAVNENGAGWDSYRAKVDLKAPESGDTGTLWRDDRIGGTSGSAVIDGSSISIDAVSGAGFGVGDDSNIYKRDIKDSLHYVSRVASGNSSISAKIVSSSGEASGIMMRDRLTSDKARYIYFGADENGNLVLQNRTRISSHQWSNTVESPKNAEIEGYTALEYPYVKLMRDHDSQTVYAFVSKDGTEWKYVTKMTTLLTYAYYSGVIATDSAQFSEVTVVETPQGVVFPFVDMMQDQATLYWTKPKQVSWFNLYRTTDEAAGQTDPELKPGSAEPVDGSMWTLVHKHTRATSYQEEGLRHGSVYFRILPVTADGAPQPFYAASVSANPIEAVMQHAESIPDSYYTKASYYLYTQELDRIKAEMAKPDADEDALIEEIYFASNLLVLYTTSLYSFEGSADNTFGSFYGDVTVNGMSAYSAGQVGQAIEMNGTDTYITLPPTHNLSTADQITIATWVNWNGNSDWQRIFDFGNGRNHYLFLTPSTGGDHKLRFALKNGGGEQFVETSQLPANEWVHVAVTLGSGTAKLYVNGEMKSENKNVTIKPSDFKPSINYIGKSQWPDPLFSGKLDEFRIYNSVLSDNEIKSIYNKTSTWYDDSLLMLLLDEASAVVAEYYKAESYEALQTAVANANAIASGDNMTQEDLDVASAGLLAALNELQPIPGLPILDSIGNKFVLAENRLAFTVQASNAEDIVYGAADLPEGASFDPETRTFEWTPAKEQGGIYLVTFTVESGELSSSRTVKIIVQGQPSIGLDTTVEVTAKQLFTYQVAASDPLGQPLVYSAANIPPSAWFDSEKGVLTWTPNQEDYGSNLVTFTVSNGSFEVSQTVDINVKLNVLPPEIYTKGSYYLYLKEVQQIEEAMNEPGANKAQLAAELDQAEGLLVSVTTLPAERIPVTSSMVVASSISWDNRFDAARNGWHAVDGNTNTFTDTQSNPGWVLIDLGAGNEQSVAGYVKFFPRINFQGRMNGAIIQGSNDGASFTDLYTVSGVTQNEWYSGVITDSTAYRYLRFYSPSGNGNVAELEFYKKPIDKTLLQILLDETNVTDTELYKEEGVQALQQEISNAQTVHDNSDATQVEIDAAAASLLAALEGLQWKDITASLDVSEPNGKNGWYTSPVTVTLSPAKIAEYSLDGGNTWLAYSEPVILDQEGTHQVQYRRTVDTGETSSLEVKIDLTAPQVTVTGDTYFTIDQDILITCSAIDTVSGVTYLPCEAPLLQIKAFTLESGQHTVTATAEDEAGHQTTVTHTFTVTATIDSLKNVTNAFLQETDDKSWKSVAESYNNKLDLAKEKADSGKIEAARGIIDGYIDQVRDQAGKFFTHEQAEILIRWAQIVI
ncbi:LamG-like jellyroll fold domain-containing protein [Paenibacillus tarimensis]